MISSAAMSFLKRFFGQPDVLVPGEDTQFDALGASERLQRILRRLRELIKADSHRRIFGADQHRYRFHRVTPEEIRLFEEKNGVELPDELREVLLYIGCGAGPYYGLFSLDLMELWFQDLCSLTDHSATLKGTSQLTDAVARDVIARRKADPKGNDAFEVAHVNGMLPLLTEGCTFYDLVILTGEQRGKVWVLDTNDMNVIPAGVVTEQSVFDWYEAWLENSFLVLAMLDEKSR